MDTQGSTRKCHIAVLNENGTYTKLTAWDHFVPAMKGDTIVIEGGVGEYTQTYRVLEKQWEESGSFLVQWVKVERL